MKSFIYALFVLFVSIWSVEAHAVPISQNFSGMHLNVEGEFISGTPVPLALQEFAPSFQLGQTITASIAYDTNQPDIDPGPFGTYRIGALSVGITELGFSASRNSSNMQISAFDNTSTPDDQFSAFVNGVDSFSNSVGLPSPLSFSVLFFGNTSMLANDLLPTSPLDWAFGNVTFNFTASDSSQRQVLMSFSPSPTSVPEPTIILLFGIGMTGLAGTRLRKKKK